MGLPKSWNEITFNEYEEFLKIESEGKSQLDFVSERISFFTGISVDELKKLPTATYKDYLQKISFIAERPKEELKDFFINDVKYSIPDNFYLISIGQEVDMLDYVGRYKGLSSLPYVLAMCVQPPNEYDGEKALKLAEEIKQFDMETIFKLDSFFLTALTQSPMASLYSSLEKMKTVLKQEIQTYRTSTPKTGGIRQSLKRWQMGIYLKWIERHVLQ